jgi:DNA ligase (NAD+)
MISNFNCSIGTIENFSGLTNVFGSFLFFSVLFCMTENLESLRAKLRRYQESYYNLEPEVSDAEYDALASLVKSMSPDAPELVAVGAPVPTHSVWEKVAHKIPMGSLGKVNSDSEFDEWVSKTGAKEFFITHKIDGSSMELVYENGNLVQCVTRGDGVIGEDVTVNVKRIPNIPHKLTKPESITVRGEVVMYKEVFEKLYAEEYANPRNTAAGKVREKKKNGEDCANLTFLAYGLLDPDPPRTMFSLFCMLEMLGFQIPEYMSANVEGVKNFFTVLCNKGRESLPYQIDGAVVSVNDLQLMEELGDINMRPRGQTAWKFESASGITPVVNVRWQVGPTGRVTPVADVEPIEIGGVTITSISLHNLSIFRDLKLWKGCRVLVSRRNDVIPYIEKNLDLPEII